MIEEYPCATERELYNREGYWICEHDTFNNGYNALINGRDKSTYIEEHKEHIREMKRNWCEKNKERVQEKRKEYCEQNKETLNKYKKEWTEQNRDSVNRRCREWYARNKDKIKSKTIVCECGVTVQERVKKRHEQSKTHLNFLEK